MSQAIQPEIFSHFKGVTIKCGAGAPPWLPYEIRGFKTAQPFRLQISKAERRVFRGKRASGRASEWAEGERVLTQGPAAGQKISFANTPFVPGLLDAIDDPCVEEVSLCFAPRTTKSTLIETFIGNRAVNDPGNALIVYPDQATGEDVFRERYKPMVDQTPSLAKLKTGYVADEKGIKIKLLTMTISLAWSGSAISLGNKSCRYVIFDEKDKHKLTPNKKEASTYALGIQRANDYPYNKKIINASTPTVESGPIWQDITKRADVLFKYHARCPDCGHLQEMVFGDPDHKGGIKWPKEIRDPREIEAGFLAWYECEKCPSRWDDLKRNQAVALGGWFGPDGRSMKAYMAAYRPKHIAAHLAGWYSWKVSISKAAASFLRGMADKLELKDFSNNIAAEPWFEYKADRKEAAIKKLADDREEGSVPGGGVVAALVAGADTHPGRLNYCIEAFGYGVDGDTWLIKKGSVTSQEALAKILWENEYKDSDGNIYPVYITMQDAMGHNTDDVYEFCRQYRDFIFPTRGEQRKSLPTSFANVDIFPGSKKPVPGGLQRLDFNTTYFKNKLSNKLDTNPTDPGAFHVFSQIDDDYCRQMTSEFRNEKGIWEQMGNRPNHDWDCAVLCELAAHYLDVKHWPIPGQEEEQADGGDDYQVSSSI